MTIKLNEQLRANIRRALLDQRFAKRLAEIKADQAALALAIYNDVFNTADQTAMNALPIGWLPEVGTIRARLNGLDFGSVLPENKKVRVPASRYGHGELSGFLFVYGADSAISQKGNALHRENRQISDDRERLTAEINQVLNSVTTANKLITVWPEIKPVVDRVVGTYVPSNNLPAVQVGDLNRSLGLVAA